MIEHIPFTNYLKTVSVTLFLIVKIVLQVLAHLCVKLLSEKFFSSTHLHKVNVYIASVNKSFSPILLYIKHIIMT